MPTLIMMLTRIWTPTLVRCLEWMYAIDDPASTRQMAKKFPELLRLSTLKRLCILRIALVLLKTDAVDNKIFAGGNAESTIITM